MKRLYFLVVYFVCGIQFLAAQDLLKRVILIGDAGEINSAQNHILDYAANLNVENKTIVFFLGDNIYPSGMPVDHKEQEDAKTTLISQFAPFRNKNIPVYFMAGNHDWNTSKENGLEKLIAQENFLKDQQDKDLKFVPQAGSLGPVLIDLAVGLKAIVYDSEYWVYPHHANRDSVSIAKKEFLVKLKDLIQQNSGNRLLILSHHPMKSYGEHSLKFGLKQHIFPFTRLNKKLYIPLPIIGSLYPLWRKYLFKSAEDLPHPVYKSLVKSVGKQTAEHKNVLFISGHDHGLQYIDDGKIKQIVSGSGSKISFILKNKKLKYSSQNQGFTVLDYYNDNSITLSYYVENSNVILKEFTTHLLKK